MTSRLPEIDFRSIREYRTSKERAFEELCYELVPAISGVSVERLVRRGTPDGGVEFSYSPRPGATWAWQAKYLFELDPSAFQQITESVESALAGTPDLERYSILLPTERSGATVHGRDNGLVRWAKHVSKWDSLAAAAGMKVDFKFIGESDLTNALLGNENAGIVRYFFDSTLLTNESLTSHFDRARAALGRRYRPDVHVDLEIEDEVEAVARSDSWLGAVSEATGRCATRGLDDYRPSWPAAKAITAAVVAVSEIHNVAQSKRGSLLDPTSDAVESCVQATKHASRAVKEALQAVADTLASEEPSVGSPRVRERLRTAQIELWRVDSQVDAVSSLFREEPGERGVLILEGEAGSGKSHLLAEIARKRLGRAAPTVLLLGQNFDGRDPWIQVAEMLDHPGLPRSELLQALSIAARLSCKGRCLVIVDAINEGDGAGMWRDHLPAVVHDVESHPWIGAVFSVRSDYASEVTTGTNAPRVSHPGLVGHEDEALDAYGSYYGVRLADLPPLLPELSNPLLLGVTCEVVSERDDKSVPRTGFGASWLYNSYIDLVQRRLASSDRLDYPLAERPVEEALAALASHAAENRTERVPWVAARNICNRVLPRGERFSETLLAGLITEGLLLQVLATDGSSYVRFTYQRFGDLWMAGALLDRNDDSDALAAAILDLVAGANGWRWAGLIAALSIVLPERLGVELIDLLGLSPPESSDADNAALESWLGADSEVAVRLLIDGLLESLDWRRVDAISDRTVELQHECLVLGAVDSATWAELLTRVACIPAHPFNMDWTHGRLSGFSLPERERAWTLGFSGHWARNVPADRVINWALQHGAVASVDVHRLAGLFLAWLLSSNNRRVRDRATVALVAMHDGHTPAPARLISKFHGIDDPYVSERLMAVGCGHALRHRRSRNVDVDGWKSLAGAAYKMSLATGCRPNILARHYARVVIETASELVVDAGESLDIDLGDVAPPYESQWPLKPPSRSALDRAFGEDGAIAIVREWDDFYRYTITYSIRDFLPPDQARLARSRRRQLSRAEASARSALDEALASLDGSTLHEVQALLAEKQEQPSYRSEIEWSAFIDQPDLENAAHEWLSARRSREDRLKEVSPEVSEALRVWEQAGRARERATKESVRLDPEDVARFVSARILELGWTADDFAETDRAIGYGRSNTAYVERVGKKYAWIGLLEALGCIADHCTVKDEYSSDPPSQYEGPWQAGYAPDMDPSRVVIERRLTRTPNSNVKPWWEGAFAHRIADMGTDEDWLLDTSDFPPLERAIAPTDPDGDTWVALEAHASWEADRGAVGPSTRTIDARRDTWLRTQAYLSKSDDIPRVREWARSKNWMGLWMPISADWDTGAYYGAYPDLPPWPSSLAQAATEAQADPDGWLKVNGLGPRVQVASVRYVFGRDRDYSLPDGFNSVLLPSTSVVSLLDAEWKPGTTDETRRLELGPNECDTAWYRDRELVAFYGTSGEWGGPSALLVKARALADAATRAGVSVWTWVLSEKIYWAGGNPSGERTDIFGSASLAPGPPTMWSLRAVRTSPSGMPRRPFHRYQSSTP